LARIQNEVQRAEAEIVQAEAELARTTIHAPFAGVVLASNAQIHATITSSTMLVVADLSGYQLRSTLTEQDALLVSVGLTATLRIDTLPDAALSGRIVHVAKMPTNASSGSEAGSSIPGSSGSFYPIQVALEGVDPRLRPGLSVSAEISVVLKTGMLLLPAQAVQHDEQGSYVRVVVSQADGTSTERRQTVELGDAIDGFVEVFNGLQVGEVVLVPGLPAESGQSATD
jgi:multidrug efflux pump subunit AcrA (membrane-fusion protein)